MGAEVAIALVPEDAEASGSHEQVFGAKSLPPAGVGVPAARGILRSARLAPFLYAKIAAFCIMQCRRCECR